MKKFTLLCALILVFGLTTSAGAGKNEHGGMDDGMGMAHHGMMKKDGAMGMHGSCAMCGMGMDGGGMMGGSMDEMHGMMMGGKAPSFYLGMKEKLGLDKKQIAQLSDIRREFRKNMVRQSADMKIAAMDLEDTFEGDWTVEEAEKQLRKVMELRADMVVQYLKARKEAEKVLTDEQLQNVRGDMMHR